VTGIEAATQRASNSAAVAVLGRFGLAVRGFTYCVIAWLAIQVALGHRTQEADQRGALVTVAHQSFGRVLLWVIGFGFASYSLWRLTEVAAGTAGEGKKAGPRIQSLVRGIVYAGLAVSTFSFIAGTSRRSQASQQVGVTAKLMRHSYGRWLVGLAGLIVIAVGIAMVIEALQKKFEKQLKMQDLQGNVRTVVLRLGMIGTAARGVVFAVAGVFVLVAAVEFDPGKSKGLDGALRSLANASAGSWLLGLLAVGLFAFGLYGLAASRFAKT
jgi:hypothetical protein